MAGELLTRFDDAIAVGLMNLFRSRANMAHIRRSRPDSGVGFQVKVLQKFKLFPFRSAGELLTRFDDAIAVGLMNTDGTIVTPNPIRGGLVFKAHRLLNHSNLGSRVINRKKKTLPPRETARGKLAMLNVSAGKR